jgi:hypothetical protein
MSKKCNKCKKNKDKSEFYKCTSKKDGLQSTCKKCQKSYIKENHNEIILYQKQYRADNPEKVKKSRDKYNDNNIEKVKSSKKRWRYNNKEYYKEYREENREQLRENNRRWEKKNLDKARAKCRRRRARKISVNENYTPENEKITLKVFGSCCFKCKSVDDITIDHHNPLSEGNALSVLNAVPLCRSCNSSKGFKKPEDFYTKTELKEIISKFGIVSEMLV